MSYKITVTNAENHPFNPLCHLIGAEFATREEACEAIYGAMYDVITGENGCEMVDRPDDFDSRRASYFTEAEAREADDVAHLRLCTWYADKCHDYILREGRATEDGVTATVEEVA